MEKITFGDNLPGYEAGDKSAPAVVVLQEWWGVNDMIKETAQMISKQGFRVLIPDLYKGKVGVDKEEASHVRDTLLLCPGNGPVKLHGVSPYSSV
eukprot:jgi/Chrzof1/11819/Cz06g11050.t1